MAQPPPSQSSSGRGGGCKLWDPLPPVHLRPKFFHPLDLGRPITNETPSPNYNQLVKRKYDPRMTIICYQQSSLSIKDGFTLWRKNFLSIIYCVWFSMMSGHSANPIFFYKKITIGRPECSLPPTPLKVGVTCVSSYRCMWNRFTMFISCTQFIFHQL